jgi:hypothetical protein
MPALFPATEWCIAASDFAHRKRVRRRAGGMLATSYFLTAGPLQLAVYDAKVRFVLVANLDSVQVPRHRRIPFKFVLDGSL